MNLLEKIFVLLVTVTAMFIYPIVTLSDQSDEITRTTVYNATSEFVEQVREQGKLTQDMYLNFISELDNTGYLYDIEFKHGHDTVVPVYETALDDVNTQVAGTDIVTYITYTDDILNTLYATNGIYTFDKGDTFSVSVKSRDETLSQKTHRLILRRNYKR